MRRKGYSVRGKPAKSHKLLCRGQHISVIAAISLLDCKIHHEPVNDDTFYSFALTHLVAFLQPFNGQNIHSVVILDNTSIPHTGQAVQAIEDTGAIVHLFTRPQSY